MGNHSGSRLRRGLARHKKLSIIVGSVAGLLTAAGIAFAMTAGGGLFSGSATLGGPSAQATADLQWQSGGSVTCTSTPISGGGNTPSTFTPTTSISSDGNTLTVNATSEPLYDGDSCTAKETVLNAGNTKTTITGVSFSVNGTPEPATLAPASIAVGPNDTADLTITITVPSGTPASSAPVSFTGKLVTS